MSKQRILTFLGLVLAALCAFSGLYLTNYLLDRQEEDLLLDVQKIPVANSFEIEDEIPEYRYLEPIYIQSLLDHNSGNWNIRYHEPLEGQMNMKQALRVARNLLDRFVEDGILAEYMVSDSYNDTSANLGSMVVPWDDDYDYRDEVDTGWGEELDDTELESGRYSYWDIYLSNNYMNTHFMIHAESGLIWYVNIYLTEEVEIDYDKVLQTYLSHIQVEDIFSDYDLLEDEWLLCYESELLLAYAYTGGAADSWISSLQWYYQHVQGYNDEVWEEPNKIELGLMVPETLG